jgi:hypothetical protein
MLTFKLRSFLMIILCSAALIEPAFSQVRLKIVDQNNAPLPNAIVEYAGAKSYKHARKDTVYVMDQVDKQFAPAYS